MKKERHPHEVVMVIITNFYTMRSLTLSHASQKTKLAIKKFSSIQVEKNSWR